MTRDGFAISCPTCSSVLRVRDERAVGQILSCPKCASMVLIEAPEAAEVAVDETISTAAEDAAAAGPPHVAMPSKPVPAGMFLLKVLGGVAASLCLMGGIGGMLMMRNTHSTVSRSVPEVAAPALDAAEGVADRNEDNPQIEAEATGPRPARESPSKSNSVPGALAVPEVVQAVTSAESPHTTATQTDEISTESGLALATHAEPAPAPAIAPTPVSPRDSSSLSSIAKLLTGEPLVTNQPKSTSDLPVMTLANTASPVGSKGLSTVHGSRSVADQTQRSLRAVRFENVPLVDFCRTMMQVSGVPIYVDPAALRQSGNTLETPVSVAAIEQSTLEVMRAALEPVRMLPIVENQTIRISSPRFEDRRVGQLSLYVGDLLSGRTREANLPAWTVALVRPDSWGSDGHSLDLKGERLVISNTHSARIDTVILTEKLRVARGLRPRQKLPKRYTTLEPRWARVRRYLSRPINMDSWQPEPIVEVIRQLEKASGLRVVFDWRSLGKLQITPQSTLTLYARARPAAQVFEELLGTIHGAKLIPISGDAVQITSEDAMRRNQYVDFYQQALLGKGARKRLEGLEGQATVIEDDGSEYVLVRATAEVHRSLIP